MRKLVLFLVLAAALIAGCEVQVITDVSVTSIPVGGSPVATAVPGQVTPAVSGEQARVVYVIDGDTIDVEMNGQEYRVRYISVNTPERNESCYADATNANRNLVQGQTVTLVRDVSDTDQYGRLLRYVYVGNTFVNAELVKGGWAEARRYAPDTSQYNMLESLEDAARRANRGCHPSGVFD